MWFSSKPIEISRTSKNELSQKKFFGLKNNKYFEMFCSEEKCVNSLPDPYVMIFLQ